MSKCKSVNWGFCAILFVVGGLSSCMMYDRDMQTDTSTQRPMAYEQATPQPSMSTTGAVKSSSSSSDPVQKSTPGPKRAAAPQIPVIQ